MEGLRKEELKEKKGEKKAIFFRFVHTVLLIVIGMLLVPFFFGTHNVPSPGDWIQEGDLEIRDGRITLLGNYVLAKISDTKSMDPTMDANSIVIARPVNSTEEINVGDMIYYEGSEGKFIVHRVVQKYSDYVVVKGDNNAIPDRYAVKNPKGVIVGILY